MTGIGQAALELFKLESGIRESSKRNLLTSEIMFFWKCEARFTENDITYDKPQFPNP